MITIIGFLVGAGIGTILFIIKEELINTYRYKRPKGKWEKEDGSIPQCWECSICGWIISAGDNEINNYCPHCGARMVEDINLAIQSSSGEQEYYKGFRNGLKYAKSLITQREPDYEHVIADMRGEE